MGFRALASPVLSEEPHETAQAPMQPCLQKRLLRRSAASVMPRVLALSAFTRQLTSRTVAEIELPGTSWGFLGGNLIYI